MAQSSPVVSTQRNFRHGDTKQERHVQNKYGTIGTSSNFQRINQNEKKSDVYVHRFSKIPSSLSNNFSRNDWRSGSQIHQNLYKHEFSDYNTKAQYLKKQFDNLTLNPKALQMNDSSSYKLSKPLRQQNPKIPQSKSMSGPKLHKSVLFKPENKAVIDKLEETYWSKWKPNKDPPPRPIFPKTKGLYTENEKNEVPYTSVTETKERGDSNEGIAIIPQNEEASETENPSVNEVVNKMEDEKVEEEIKTVNLNEKDTTEVPVADNNKAIILMPESPSDCDVSELKHTDSYILTSKKKSVEKSHFQQPKCIKLFKNAGYTTKTSTNYIKGGSYPLKSCLKKEKNESKLSCLSGHSVAPVRSSIRRPGKANRFTT